MRVLVVVTEVVVPPPLPQVDVAAACLVSTLPNSPGSVALQNYDCAVVAALNIIVDVPDKVSCSAVHLVVNVPLLNHRTP